MAVNLLILICLILFLIMPRIIKSGEFMVEDIHAWKDITGFLKDPVIRLKIIITLVLLIVYVSGTYILLPGLDLEILRNNPYVHSIQSRFSMKRFSVFALGVMPFITVNGLLLLSAIAVPALRKFSRSRQSSSRLINQLVYLLTIILCIVQSFGLSKVFQALGAAHGRMFNLTTVLLLTMGTIIMLLLAKGIRKFGIGHGISLIIALSWVINLNIESFQGISFQATVIDRMAGLLFMITALILGIWIMRVQRVIMVEDVYTGEKIPLPFSLNQAGIFPVILASTLLMLPLQLIVMFNINGTPLNYFMSLLHPGNPVYYLAHVVLIVSISLIYGVLVINPNNMIMRLKQNNLRIIDEPQNKKRNILFAAVLQLNLLWAVVLIVYFVLLTLIMSRISNLVISANMPVIIIAAVIAGCLHTLRVKKKNLEEIYKHTEPGEILVAKSFLETKGINTVMDNDEAYGWLFGFFTGPLAARRLFVEAEDFPKASELMEEYNLRKLVESE